VNWNCELYQLLAFYNLNMGILIVRNCVGLMNSQFTDYKMKFKIFGSTCCRVLLNINEETRIKAQYIYTSFLGIQNRSMHKSDLERISPVRRPKLMVHIRIDCPLKIGSRPHKVWRSYWRWLLLVHTLQYTYNKSGHRK